MKDYISEAEALEDSGFHVTIDEDEDDGVMWGLKRPQRKTPVQYSDGSVRYETVVKEVNGRVITSERQKDIKQLYDVAKAAKVGTEIVCPVCKEKHKKTTYHKVFCSNGKKSRKDCKSKYWNTIHPERLDRIF
ncbi:hypothetical protein KKP3664_000072 [Citrobacter phage KKP_3664]|nr:hypothetical protein KKP3664_000072 [Citrobacter phage KKP_3664]